MKPIVLAVVAALAAAPAFACDDTLFTVEDWTLGERLSEASRFSEIAVSARYNGEKAIRMVEGFLFLKDPLGRTITQTVLPEDLRAEPGEVVAIERNVEDRNDRLYTVSKHDVAVKTCTAAVVYDDGSIERFPGGLPDWFSF